MTPYSFFFTGSQSAAQRPYTFQNVGTDYNQQLNSFISQHPTAQQGNIYKQLQNNFGILQAQIQQQGFQLPSFLQGLFAANGNYADNMQGGRPVDVYNDNEVPNESVQVQHHNDHVENNNRVQSNDNQGSTSVVVLLSQDEIRK